MGVIQCPRHGIKGIALVCPHVRDALVNVGALMTITKVTADLAFEGYKMEASFCPVCVTEANSENGGLDRIGEDGLNWFERLETVPVCSDCLAEAERQ